MELAEPQVSCQAVPVVQAERRRWKTPTILSCKCAYVCLPSFPLQMAIAISCYLSIATSFIATSAQFWHHHINTSTSHSLLLHICLHSLQFLALVPSMLCIRLVLIISCSANVYMEKILQKMLHFIFVHSSNYTCLEAV